MPPVGWRYTLVGFSIQLDWRPLVFVDPLPTFRVCSACGLVRRKTALLPCFHALCEYCYMQNAQDGTCTCPRDGCPYELPMVVTWEEFHPRELLKLQVKCINEENGCDHVVMAAKMRTHLRRQCEHHAACCPVCSDTVLCKDICAHLRSGCNTKAAPLASQLEGQFQCMDVTQVLPSYEWTLQSAVEEMKACLACLISDSKAQCDRLSGLSSGISIFEERVEGQINRTILVFGESFQAVYNHVYIQNITGQPVTGAREIEALKKELKKELMETMKQNLDTLMNGTRELFVAAKEAEQSLLSKLDLIVELSRKAITVVQNSMVLGSDTSSESHENLADVSTSVTALELGTHISVNVETRYIPQRIPELTPFSLKFPVKDVNSLYSRAYERGFRCYCSPRVYLGGYCVTPGICIINTRGTLALHIGIQLHMGNMDDAVQWTFNHKVKMTVLHPNGHDEIAVEVRKFSNSIFVQRHLQSNKPCFYFTPSLNLTNLINDGYAADDQLRLMYELLP
uniref:TRAF1-6 MATH domain-containing protein n=1 Tax=Amblyomma maculatum TaxID=34609 RepID=G3MT63_AMBMU